MSSRFTHVAGIVVAISVFLIGYFLISNDKSGGAPVTDVSAFELSTTAGNNSLVLASTEKNESAPEGFREYRNQSLNFSVMIPSNLKVAEFDDGGGAKTIAFENGDQQNPKGFQIFIVPYNSDQVSREQFLRDVPSGVILEQKNITINGVFGTMFYSQDVELGETREVWFIRGGYLYEVTAPKALDTWLLSVLQYWTFL